MYQSANFEEEWISLHLLGTYQYRYYDALPAHRPRYRVLQHHLRAKNEEVR